LPGPSIASEAGRIGPQSVNQLVWAIVAVGGGCRDEECLDADFPLAGDLVQRGTPAVERHGEVVDPPPAELA
jgi:hypothetical protein